MKKPKRHGRKKPYSEAGVKRLPCVRCGKPAYAQWNACADGLQRPICKECDVLLNFIVLMFMEDPDIDEKMRKYVEAIGPET
jgi:NAD-dependent SIR2 family protein deacetylase